MYTYVYLVALYTKVQVFINILKLYVHTIENDTSYNGNIATTINLSLEYIVIILIYGT